MYLMLKLCRNVFEEPVLKYVLKNSSAEDELATIFMHEKGKIVDYYFEKIPNVNTNIAIKAFNGDLVSGFFSFYRRSTTDFA